MSTSLGRRAGMAMVWEATHLAGARVISLVRFLVLAWILEPSDFGLLAIAIVSLELLGAVTNLGIRDALIHHRRPSQGLFDAAWTVEIIRATLLLMLVLVAAPYIAGLYGEAAATDILRGLAFAPLIAAFSSIGLRNLETSLRFRPIAIIGLATASVEAIASILLAPQFGVWGLVFGLWIATAMRTVLSYVVAPHRPRLVRDLTVITPLLRFGRWVLLAAAVDTFGEAVLRGLISRRSGPAELGLYFIAYRLAFLPQAMASGITRRVAFSVYAALQESSDRARSFFRKTVFGISALFFPVYALLFALAPSLASVLGERWSGSDSLIQVLALASMLLLVSEYTRPLVSGFGKPHLATMMSAVRYGTILLFAAPLTHVWGAFGAGVSWLASGVVVMTLALVLAQRTLTRPFRGLFRHLLAVVIASIAGACIAGAAARVTNGALELVVGFAAGTAAIATALLLLDRLWQLGLRADFDRLIRVLSADHQRGTSATVDHSVRIDQPPGHGTQQGLPVDSSAGSATISKRPDA